MGEAKDMKKQEKIFLAIIAIILVISIFFIFIVLPSITSDESKIIGTWERDTGKRLTFFDDGTAYWGNEEYC